MSEKYKSSDFGLLLKELLKERSLSIRQFSKLTQIDSATISRIINRIRKATPEHLQRFADCLDIPSSELFAAAGYPIKQSQSDIHKTIDNIQEFLESSDSYHYGFSLEGVEQELAGYERYSQTEEGKRTILDKFEDKIQKVGSTGPFINHLKDMYEKFRLNTCNHVEKALIGSALLYFILPIDCIPDYVFPIGYLDDAIAVKLVIRSLQKNTPDTIR